jgi:RNA polymerase sigma-70 factor (ECF subfamily)
VVAEAAAPAGVGRSDQEPLALAEAALVRRCQAGEADAFAELVAQHQDRLYNVIVRMCRHAADAEELAQEAFLRAFERIGQFRGGSRFYTWLFRVAVNLTISRRRRGGKVKFISLTGGDEDAALNSAEAVAASTATRRTPGPEAAAMARETHDRVQQALGELDDDFRAVVVLRDIEEMDYGEIAEVLDVPVGTVKSRLHRGRCMLKDKLADLVNDR